jgi:hypothetical protein
MSEVRSVTDAAGLNNRTAGGRGGVRVNSVDFARVSMIAI